MFTFSLLTPGEGNFASKASFICVDDDVKILADISWNGKNHNDLNYLRDVLKQVNFIILSHSTPEFIGGYVMLCLKFPDLMKSLQVYATSAVSQLGRVSTAEYYRALGVIGPLKDALLEVSDVDEWFDRVINLRYHQTTSLLDRLSITPYNSGHTLGGSFWLIQRKLERIIYAPNWNHSKDSFLNGASFFSSSTGNPISQLMRPTGLITGTDIGSTMPHRKRAERFLQLVDATLANGGTVLLPTTISGRFLELLHLVDQHLQSAPIPVLFLSYSGTNVLRYATNLLEWMSSSLSKELETANSIVTDSNNRNHYPFDPSKVDLVGSPYELAHMTGPKVVFCSGVDFNNGDLSSEALRVLCNDEKTTIILTEKTHFGNDNTINSKLYKEWSTACEARNEGRVEDGMAIPLEITLNLNDWTLEEELVGSELTDFRERINIKRKQKLIEQARDRKNKVLTGENFGESSSDEEDEDDDDDDIPPVAIKEEAPPQESEKATNGDVDMDQESNGTLPADSLPAGTIPTVSAAELMDDAAAQEAIVAENIKASFDKNLPLDIKVTNKLRPRQAMFPFFPNKNKQDFDDYGAVINPKDFEKKEEINTQFGLENKRNLARNWGTTDDADPHMNNQNKLTPQELLNNDIIQKNLDTLYLPRKRVEISSANASYNLNQLQIRCGLSFVDLSGLVDLRSLGLIVSSLKPANLLLLPDSSAKYADDNKEDGSTKIYNMLVQQQTQGQTVDDKQAILKAARYLSLQSLRNGELNKQKSNKMEILVVKENQELQVGTDDNGSKIGDFEVKLDESLVESLQWQTIDGSYRVAQVVGQLEVEHPKIKKRKTAEDIINQASEFTLKQPEPELMKKYTSLNRNKLAIGNIRLPELKKKLQSKNLNAEFKGEGTLVVNDTVSIRKITYGNSESDDTGDIVINGQIGPLFYEVKQSIREMLAYV